MPFFMFLLACWLFFCGCLPQKTSIHLDSVTATETAADDSGETGDDTASGEDLDGDGYSAADGDCDDADAEVHPGATEVWYDGRDQDCDGASDYDVDRDGYDSDGYGGSDCDDTDAAVSPAAVESCDGYDQDCDGAVDDDASDASAWYADADGDGYGDAGAIETACEAPPGYVADASDCDDGDFAVNPASPEVCGDGIENDCDAATDDETGDLWYADADSDGYGDAATSLRSCEEPAGYVTLDTDCDDADASVNPGASEYCDEVDNDCDGSTDEDDAVDAATWYRDADSDGYGDSSRTATGCEQPTGYVSDGSDCDDADASVNPGESESCDGFDTDCDGSLSSEEMDGDGDGVTECDGDCDGADATIYPGASESCDGADNDCDGSADEGVTSTFYRDADSDGYGDAASSVEDCSAPSGYVADSTDCDDGESTAHPGGSEICDWLDNDCDGATDDDDSGVTGTYTWYADADSDGYGDSGSTASACEMPTGYMNVAGDCDDADASVNPGASESCNGVDDDCSGSVQSDEVDADSDGYAECDGDCDDSDGAAYPGASEACDGADNDCDGATDEDFDADGDGFASSSACAWGDDCDDADASVSPDGYEVAVVASGSSYAVDNAGCSDGADNDCDGASDSSDSDCDDIDGDGVENGIDLLVPLDADSDGYDDTLCVVADSDFVLPSPWNTYDAILQGTGWGGFSVLDSTYTETLGGFDTDDDGTDDLDGWCSYFPDDGLSTGAYHGRFVSVVAADGSTSAPSTCSTASTSTTWKRPDMTDWCDATGDPYCRSGYSGNDGCNDNVNAPWRIRYCSNTDSIEPYSSSCP